MIFGFGGKNLGKNDPRKYLDAFLGLIPEYCVDQNRRLIGSPEQWQPRIISYALYLGLGIGYLDKNLNKRLLEGVTAGMTETSDLVLKGMNEVKNTPHSSVGDKWSHAVNFLSNFMSLTSPETTGSRADERLVKQRAPISGFIPALRLSMEDPLFARALYTDSVVEQNLCSHEELQARIEWMENFVDEVMEEI